MRIVSYTIVIVLYSLCALTPFFVFPLIQFAPYPHYYYRLVFLVWVSGRIPFALAAAVPLILMAAFAISATIVARHIGKLQDPSSTTQNKLGESGSGNH